jgi:glutathione peroxidase
MIVNTASECGYTPQYEGLQKLYDQYQSRGFELLAFPSNDFGGQEPGTNEEVKAFCTANFHTTFPLFAKISVKTDPLYAFLQARGAVKWNFYKFIVDAKGEISAALDSRAEPTSEKVKQLVEAALPKAG